MKNLSLKQKHQVAKRSYDNLIKFKQIASVSYLYIGKELKRIKDEKLYKYLGKDSEEYEDFNCFLRTPEINMDLRKAYYLMQIWGTFVERYKFKEEDLAGIPWTSLRAILPISKPENAQDLVEKARLLTRSHLEQEVKQLRAGINNLGDLSECKHLEVIEAHYYRCKVCGERFQELPKGSKIVK